MSDAVKFNLPKVQFRVKTTASDTIQSEANCTLHRQFGPSVLQERFKMKKEIQESYMRFRRRKKNNYIKQFSSTKKCSPNPEEKKMNTIEIKNKIKPTEDKVKFSLQAKEHQIVQIHHRETEQENHNHIMHKVKQNGASPPRDVLIGSFKPFQTKTNFLSRHFSLYDTDMPSELKQQLELKGTKWNCWNQNQSKKQYTQIMRVKSQAKTKKASRKSSTYKIDGWKPEEVARRVGFFENEQLEIDY